MTISRVSRPRVLATDLDGTLLRSDGTLSARTRAALRTAEDSGVDVVFVTARPPRWVQWLADAVAPHGQVICIGGGCVMDLTSGAVVESDGFEDTDILSLAEQLRRAVPGMGLGLECVDGGRYEHRFGYDARWSAYDVDPVHQGESVEGMLTGPHRVSKMLARRPGSITADDRPTLTDAAMDQFIDTLQDAAGDLATLEYSGVGGLAEFLPRHVSKASALERWCTRRGVGASEVWAFGDMPNDLSMLTWAGTGFAMSNAHPRVRAAADRIAPTNDEDGVAAMIEHAVG